MRRFGIFLVLASAGFAASCNCGTTASFSCHIDADCKAGQICVGGTCKSGIRNGDGGFTLTDGGTNGDGGNNNGGDGGQHSADGGPCVGLQCQQVSCPGSSTTSLSGYVYDPSGQVPLYDVLVYVPNSQIQPFPVGVSCEQCGASVTGSPLVITLTDSSGHFSLGNVPIGNGIPLVMQIGRWRRQVTIDVPTTVQCMDTVVPASKTHMPTTQNEDPGDNIPHMAIASGSADPFECLLSKMALAGEMAPPGGGKRIDYYHLNGIPMSGSPAGSQLYNSLTNLETYDIVLLPCEGGADGQNGSTVKTTQQTQNIIDYTSDGGRLFVTHYGYEWIAGGPTGNPPPHVVQAPFPSTADWTNLDQNPPPDPIQVTLNQGFPKGRAFASWLVNVNAATDAGIFTISQSRLDVGVVNAPAPSYVEPTTAWMFGDPSGNTNGAPPNYSWTPHLTFNTPYNPPKLPDGDAGVQCGRVVYSDFHVTTDDQNGNPTFPSECKNTPFTAQEKALVFMLFDLSSCVQSNTIAPTVCAPVNGACTKDADCCAGLSCLNNTGGGCSGVEGGGSGCACAAPFG